MTTSKNSETIGKKRDGRTPSAEIDPLAEATCRRRSSSTTDNDVTSVQEIALEQLPEVNDSHDDGEDEDEDPLGEVVMKDEEVEEEEEKVQDELERIRRDSGTSCSSGNPVCRIDDVFSLMDNPCHSLLQSDASGGEDTEEGPPEVCRRSEEKSSENSCLPSTLPKAKTSTVTSSDRILASTPTGSDEEDSEAVILTMCSEDDADSDDDDANKDDNVKEKDKEKKEIGDDSGEKEDISLSETSLISGGDHCQSSAGADFDDLEDDLFGNENGKKADSFETDDSSLSLDPADTDESSCLGKDEESCSASQDGKADKTVHKDNSKEAVEETGQDALKFQLSSIPKPPQITNVDNTPSAGKVSETRKMISLERSAASTSDPPTIVQKSSKGAGKPNKTDISKNIASPLEEANSSCDKELSGEDSNTSQKSTDNSNTNVSPKGDKSLTARKSPKGTDSSVDNEPAGKTGDSPSKEANVLDSNVLTEDTTHSQDVNNSSSCSLPSMRPSKSPDCSKAENNLPLREAQKPEERANISASNNNNKELHVDTNVCTDKSGPVAAQSISSSSLSVDVDESDKVPGEKVSSPEISRESSSSSPSLDSSDVSEKKSKPVSKQLPKDNQNSREGSDRPESDPSPEGKRKSSDGGDTHDGKLSSGKSLKPVREASSNPDKCSAKETTDTIEKPYKLAPKHPLKITQRKVSGESNKDAEKSKEKIDKCNQPLSKSNVGAEKSLEKTDKSSSQPSSKSNKDAEKSKEKTDKPSNQPSSKSNEDAEKSKEKIDKFSNQPLSKSNVDAEKLEEKINKSNQPSSKSSVDAEKSKETTDKSSSQPSSKSNEDAEKSQEKIAKSPNQPSSKANVDSEKSKEKIDKSSCQPSSESNVDAEKSKEKTHKPSSQPSSKSNIDTEKLLEKTDKSSNQPSSKSNVDAEKSKEKIAKSSNKPSSKSNIDAEKSQEKIDKSFSQPSSKSNIDAEKSQEKTDKSSSQPSSKSNVDAEKSLEKTHKSSNQPSSKSNADAEKSKEKTDKPSSQPSSKSNINSEKSQEKTDKFSSQPSSKANLNTEKSQEKTDKSSSQPSSKANLNTEKSQEKTDKSSSQLSSKANLNTEKSQEKTDKSSSQPSSKTNLNTEKSQEKTDKSSSQPSSKANLNTEKSQEKTDKSSSQLSSKSDREVLNVKDKNSDRISSEDFKNLPKITDKCSKALSKDTQKSPQISERVVDRDSAKGETEKVFSEVHKEKPLRSVKNRQSVSSQNNEEPLKPVLKLSPKENANKNSDSHCTSDISKSKQKAVARNSDSSTPDLGGPVTSKDDKVNKENQVDSSKSDGTLHTHQQVVSKDSTIISRKDNSQDPQGESCLPKDKESIQSLPITVVENKKTDPPKEETENTDITIEKDLTQSAIKSSSKPNSPNINKKIESKTVECIADGGLLSEKKESSVVGDQSLRKSGDSLLEIPKNHQQQKQSDSVSGKPCPSENKEEESDADSINCTLKKQVADTRRDDESSGGVTKKMDTCQEMSRSEDKEVIVKSAEVDNRSDQHLERNVSKKVEQMTPAIKGNISLDKKSQNDKDRGLGKLLQQLRRKAHVQSSSEKGDCSSQKSTRKQSGKELKHEKTTVKRSVEENIIPKSSVTPERIGNVQKQAEVNAEKASKESGEDKNENEQMAGSVSQKESTKEMEMLSKVHSKIPHSSVSTSELACVDHTPVTKAPETSGKVKVRSETKEIKDQNKGNLSQPNECGSLKHPQGTQHIQGESSNTSPEERTNDKNSSKNVKEMPPGGVKVKMNIAMEQSTVLSEGKNETQCCKDVEDKTQTLQKKEKEKCMANVHKGPITSAEGSKNQRNNEDSLNLEAEKTKLTTGKKVEGGSDSNPDLNKTKEVPDSIQEKEDKSKDCLTLAKDCSESSAVKDKQISRIINPEESKLANSKNSEGASIPKTTHDNSEESNSGSEVSDGKDLEKREKESNENDTQNVRNDFSECQTGNSHDQDMADATEVAVKIQEKSSESVSVPPPKDSSKDSGVKVSEKDPASVIKEDSKNEDLSTATQKKSVGSNSEVSSESSENDVEGSTKTESSKSVKESLLGKKDDPAHKNSSIPQESTSAKPKDENASNSGKISENRESESGKAERKDIGKVDSRDSINSNSKAERKDLGKFDSRDSVKSDSKESIEKSNEKESSNLNKKDVQKNRRSSIESLEKDKSSDKKDSSTDKSKTDVQKNRRGSLESLEKDKNKSSKKDSLADVSKELQRKNRRNSQELPEGGGNATDEKDPKIDKNKEQEQKKRRRGSQESQERNRNKADEKSLSADMSKKAEQGKSRRDSQESQEKNRNKADEKSFSADTSKKDEQRKSRRDILESVEKDRNKFIEKNSLADMNKNKSQGKNRRYSLESLEEDRSITDEKDSSAGMSKIYKQRRRNSLGSLERDRRMSSEKDSSAVKCRRIPEAWKKGISDRKNSKSSEQPNQSRKNIDTEKQSKENADGNDNQVSQKLSGVEAIEGSKVKNLEIDKKSPQESKRVISRDHLEDQTQAEEIKKGMEKCGKSKDSLESSNICVGMPSLLKAGVDSVSLTSEEESSKTSPSASVLEGSCRQGSSLPSDEDPKLAKVIRTANEKKSESNEKNNERSHSDLPEKDYAELKKGSIEKGEQKTTEPAEMEPKKISESKGHLSSKVEESILNLKDQSESKDCFSELCEIDSQKKSKKDLDGQLDGSEALNKEADHSSNEIMKEPEDMQKNKENSKFSKDHKNVSDTQTAKVLVTQNTDVEKRGEEDNIQKNDCVYKESSCRVMGEVSLAAMDVQITPKSSIVPQICKEDSNDSKDKNSDKTSNELSEKGVTTVKQKLPTASTCEQNMKLDKVSELQGEKASDTLPEDHQDSTGTGTCSKKEAGSGDISDPSNHASKKPSFEATGSKTEKSEITTSDAANSHSKPLSPTLEETVTAAIEELVSTVAKCKDDKEQEDTSTRSSPVEKSSSSDKTGAVVEGSKESDSMHPDKKPVNEVSQAIITENVIADTTKQLDDAEDVKAVTDKSPESSEKKTKVGNNELNRETNIQTAGRKRPSSSTDCSSPSVKDSSDGSDRKTARLQLDKNLSSDKKHSRKHHSSSHRLGSSKRSSSGHSSSSRPSSGHSSSSRPSSGHSISSRDASKNNSRSSSLESRSSADSASKNKEKSSSHTKEKLHRSSSYSSSDRKDHSQRGSDKKSSLKYDKSSSQRNDSERSERKREADSKLETKSSKNPERKDKKIEDSSKSKEKGFDKERNESKDKTRELEGKAHRGKLEEDEKNTKNSQTKEKKETTNKDEKDAGKSTEKAKPEKSVAKKPKEDVPPSFFDKEMAKIFGEDYAPEPKKKKKKKIVKKQKEETAKTYFDKEMANIFGEDFATETKKKKKKDSLCSSGKEEFKDQDATKAKEVSEKTGKDTGEDLNRVKTDKNKTTSSVTETSTDDKGNLEVKKSKPESSRDEKPNKENKHEKPNRENSKDERLSKENSKDEKPNKENKCEKPDRENSKDEKPVRGNSNDEKPIRENSKDEKPDKEHSKDERLSKENSKDEKPNRENSKDEKLKKENSKDEKPYRENSKDEKPDKANRKDERLSKEDSKDEKPNKETNKDEKPSKENSKDEKPNRENSKDEKPSRESSKDEKPDKENRKDEKPNRENSKDGRLSKENSKDEKLNRESRKDEKPNTENSKDGKPNRENSKDEKSNRESSKDEKPEVKKRNSCEDEKRKEKSNSDKKTTKEKTKDDRTSRKEKVKLEKVPSKDKNKDEKSLRKQTSRDDRQAVKEKTNDKPSRDKSKDGRMPLKEKSKDERVSGALKKDEKTPNKDEKTSSKEKEDKTAGREKVRGESDRTVRKSGDSEKDKNSKEVAHKTKCESSSLSKKKEQEHRSIESGSSSDGKEKNMSKPLEKVSHIVLSDSTSANSSSHKSTKNSDIESKKDCKDSVQTDQKDLTVNSKKIEISEKKQKQCYVKESSVLNKDKKHSELPSGSKTQDKHHSLSHRSNREKTELNSSVDKNPQPSTSKGSHALHDTEKKKASKESDEEPAEKLSLISKDRDGQRIPETTVPLQGNKDLDNPVATAESKPCNKSGDTVKQFDSGQNGEGKILLVTTVNNSICKGKKHLSRWDMKERTDGEALPVKKKSRWDQVDSSATGEEAKKQEDACEERKRLKQMVANLFGDSSFSEEKQLCEKYKRKPVAVKDKSGNKNLSKEAVDSLFDPSPNFGTKKESTGMRSHSSSPLRKDQEKEYKPTASGKSSLKMTYEPSSITKGKSDSEYDPTSSSRIKPKLDKTPIQGKPKPTFRSSYKASPNSSDKSKYNRAKSDSLLKKCLGDVDSDAHVVSGVADDEYCPRPFKLDKPCPEYIPSDISDTNYSKSLSDTTSHEEYVPLPAKPSCYGSGYGISDVRSSSKDAFPEGKGNSLPITHAGGSVTPGFYRERDDSENSQKDDNSKRGDKDKEKSNKNVEESYKGTGNNKQKTKVPNPSTKSCKSVVLVYCPPPPSNDDILSSLSDYNIPDVIHEGAFFSNKLDIPAKPMEVGGQLLKLKSREVSDLENFEGRHQDNGIYNWRFLLNTMSVDSSGSTLSDSKVDKKNSKVNLKCVLTPVKLPPSPAEVKRWAEARKILKSTKKDKEGDDDDDAGGSEPEKKGDSNKKSHSGPPPHSGGSGDSSSETKKSTKNQSSHHQSRDHIPATERQTISTQSQSHHTSTPQPQKFSRLQPLQLTPITGDASSEAEKTPSPAFISKRKPKRRVSWEEGEPSSLKVSLLKKRRVSHEILPPVLEEDPEVAKPEKSLKRRVSFSDVARSHVSPASVVNIDASGVEEMSDDDDDKTQELIPMPDSPEPSEACGSKLSI